MTKISNANNATARSVALSMMCSSRLTLGASESRKTESYEETESEKDHNDSSVDVTAEILTSDEGSLLGPRALI